VGILGSGGSEGVFSVCGLEKAGLGLAMVFGTAGTAVAVSAVVELGGSGFNVVAGGMDA
jgi:hypothetical protein